MEEAPHSGPEIPNTEDLQRQLATIDRREGRLDSKIEHVEQRLGRLALHEGVRAGVVLDTSETVGKRFITDPYKPGSEIPRADETFIGRHTLGGAIGHVATQRSVNGPRGAELRAQAAGRPEQPPDSFLGRQTGILGARRVRRQELRQARAKWAEATMGAGMGLGQKTKLRTAKHRHGLKKEAREAYKSGDITARQLIDEGRRIKREEEVAVPARAVRREVRRERAGAMYSHARADQPIRKRVRAFRVKRNEKALNKYSLAKAGLAARRVEIEAELERRASEDTED